MTTHVGVGFSQDINQEKAARDAAFEAKSNLNQARIDAAIVFFTIHYQQAKVLPTLNKVLNKARIIGCSTAGIIQSRFVETRGITVVTITSDEIKFSSGQVADLNVLDPYQAAVNFAQECTASADQQRQALLFFIDGRFRSTSEFLNGLRNILGNVFPLLGAGSCDDFRFEKSFQTHNYQALENSAVGFLLGGQMGIGIGARHGWKPLGKPRFVDNATNNIIHTIDGQRASSLYEEFFGKDSPIFSDKKLGRMRVLYPLGIYLEGSQEYLLRNAVDILNDGSIVCQGDVPKDSEVHIMIGDKNSCRTAAADAAREAQQQLQGKPAKLVLILESLSRLKLQGRLAHKEIVRIQKIFGEKVPIVGMYCDGEIFPIDIKKMYKKAYHQNESIIILALG